MKQRTLGKTGLLVSRLAYGTMRISGAWEPAQSNPDMRRAGVRALLTAFDAGYTLFDHADLYGRFLCETLHGLALRESPQLRNAKVATKCGIRLDGDPVPSAPHRYDFSYEHIVRSCEGSLQRLGVEVIDLFQLHRPDYLADPAEIARAFSDLHQQGKAKAFGVSNFTPSQFSALQSACPMPLASNQVEINLCNLAPFIDGTLDQSLERGFSPMAWGPLAGGMHGEGGAPREDDVYRESTLGLLR
jgi:predicted oxidoreductase